MTLGFRKLIVIASVALIVVIANFLIIAAWLQEHGIIAIANYLQVEFLTGTAITIIIVLMILHSGGVKRRCAVCEKPLRGNTRYCGHCGSKL